MYVLDSMILQYFSLAVCDLNTVMVTTLKNSGTEVKGLASNSNYGHRKRVGGSTWNFDRQASVQLVVDDDYISDEESVVSTGSAITVETSSMSSLFTDKTPMVAILVTPCSFSVTPFSTVGSSNISPSTPTTNLTVRNNKNLALLETPPEARPKVRMQPDDCHVLIRWSQLERFIKRLSLVSVANP
jgi:hypothetical protein